LYNYYIRLNAGGKMGTLVELSNLKILLVEPDPLMADTFYNFFKNNNCFFTTTKSAEGGARLLEMQTFDVLISEHELPEHDGLTFFTGVTGLNSNAVKILITNYGDPDPQGSASAVDDIIIKPFSFEVFCKVLLRHLKKRGLKATG